MSGRPPLSPKRARHLSLKLGFPPPTRTILNTIEPLSPEEQAQFMEERRKEWIDQIWPQVLFAAIKDKEFLQILCRDVASVARGDAKLVGLIRNRLKSKRGGGGHSNRAPDWWPRFLLQHYAVFMEQGEGETYAEREKKAIRRLIEHYERITGRRVGFERMNNQISEAIIKVDSTDLDEWARPFIEERKRRGKKYHKPPR